MRLRMYPAMIPNVLQQVGMSNPALAGLITTNLEEFRQWIMAAPLPEGTQITLTQEEMTVV